MKYLYSGSILSLRKYSMMILNDYLHNFIDEAVNIKIVNVNIKTIPKSQFFQQTSPSGN